MLLKIENLKKHFPVKGGTFGRRQGVVRAVDDVSLTVAKGEHLSLVGESGCGKTTLGRMVLRLLDPDAGRILFGGRDIAGLKPKQLRPFRGRMQMVFQDPYNSLDPRFTIRSTLKEALVYDRKSSGNEREEKMAKMLTAVGLKTEMLDRFPHEFSGGERQRVAIARALIMNPELVILDEAVSSLDVLIQEQIVALLARLQEEFDLTYLFISHNLRVVRKISRRIAVMYQGKIVEVAPVEKLFEDPRHPYTKELLCAAIEYRVPRERARFRITSESRLVDQGDGHFVLEE